MDKKSLKNDKKVKIPLFKNPYKYEQFKDEEDIQIEYNYRISDGDLEVIKSKPNTKISLISKSHISSDNIKCQPKNNECIIM